MQILINTNNKVLAMADSLYTLDNTLQVISTTLTFTDWQTAENSPASTNPQEIAYNPTSQTLFSRDRALTNDEQFWQAVQNFITNCTNDINNWPNLQASDKDTTLLRNTKALRAIMQRFIARKM